MSVNNTPSPGDERSTEQVETMKDGKYFGTINDLLEGCVEDLISDEKPDALIEYEKDTSDFNTKMRTLMKRRKDKPTPQDIKDKVDWSSVKESHIDSVGGFDIAEKVRKRTKSLIALRNEAFVRIKDVFPNVRNIDDWESKIQKELRLEKVSTLRKMLSQRGYMKKFLQHALGEIGTDILTPQVAIDYKEIFFDLDDQGPTVSQKREFEKMFSDYKKYRSIPDIDTIRELLFVYRNVPDSRKKTLLSALDATLPLSVALSLGLIGDSELQQIAIRNFGSIYSDLDPSEKKKFIEGLSYENIEEIPIGVSTKDIDASKLGRLFGSKAQVNKVSESIISRMSIERSSADIKEDTTVLGKAMNMFPDDDHHAAFLKYVEKMLRSSDKTRNTLDGIENFKPGGVVRFGEKNSYEYFRLEQTEDKDGLPLDVHDGYESGVKVNGLNHANGYIKSVTKKELSYDELYAFFSRELATVVVLSENEFKENVLVPDTEKAGIDGKLYDASNLDEEEVSASNIVAKLDQFDPEGRLYGFEKGTYFSAPEENNKGEISQKIWKVESLAGNKVTLLRGGGTKIQESLADIVLLAENNELNRVNKITSDSEFVSLLSKNHGIAENAVIENNQIVQKNIDEEGKETKEIMKAFESESGGHIRIAGIQDGIVHFGEYKDTSENEQARKFAEKNGAEKAFKKYYDENRMTYGAFIEYLRENKLTKATSNDIIDPHAHSSLEHGHDHDHMEGNFFSRLGKMQSFGSMWKGFEMIYHSIEHTLEKGSKLDAARFAMGTAKFLHLPDSIEAQLYADIVDGSKEIVEKYKNKIANLPGPKGRLKCIHIAHNRDARPEEVMAAIQFMVSGYGHLYAEDTREFQSVVTPSNLATKPQGYFAYLDAFIHTARLPSVGGESAIIHWRRKAYDKAKPELGSEGEPPEEHLLHALFKSIDGNPEDFPYAAAVVKSIGGPGGYEKDWKFEGYKNAVQKGKDQTGMVNAQGRLNKAMGYLSTHEFYKAIGGMEKVAGKIKTPHFQALPFVWAVGGYTKYTNPTALQDLKNYGETGFSFHGYAFLRKESDNMVYRETVRLALIEMKNQGKIGQEAVDEFNTICSRFDHGIESAEVTEKKYGKNNPPPVAMMNFWQKYQGKGLHDMLQNNDGWITKMSKENSTIKKYREQLVGAHAQQLRDANIPGGEVGKDWFDEHGFGYSLIMRDSEGNMPEEKGLRSLYSNLNKIKFTGTNRGGKPMEDNTKEKVWEYLVKNVIESSDIGKFYGDENLQKRQYLFWRKELIGFFNGQLNAGEVKNNEDIERNIRTPQFTYFRDFEAMGIDPRAIYKQELIKTNAESDYITWRAQGKKSRRHSPTSDVIDSVRGMVPRNIEPGRYGERNSWRDADDTWGSRRSTDDSDYNADGD